MTPLAPSAKAALRAVDKTFASGAVALRDFDLTVRDGEFVSLLGASGCGKSTALRILAGLTAPTAGEVIRAADVTPGRIGFVFQEPTLMPWATVAANAALPLTLQRIAADVAAARTDAALARVGLSSVAAAYPRELSGGMKMRVSIARALTTDPALLLMDEPFAALDEITRSRLNDDLLQVWQALRQTVVFVTHSVAEAVYLSQRILVMRSRPGAIAAEIAIDAPLPRPAGYRGSGDYAATCARVFDALRNAAGDSPAGATS